MRLKDYYKTLEIPAAAGPEEIKKSFRRLALQYHPDKNTDNPFAAGHFREIREAYAILSDPGRRQAYDEQRWLSGMSTRARDQVRVTPDWILQEARRLRRHMEVIDTFRMSHKALHDYILLLLSDEHMDVLRHAGDTERNAAIIRELLAAIRRMKAVFMQPVTERMSLLSGTDTDLQAAIGAALRERQREERWDRYFPAVIIAAVLFLLLTWMIVSHLG
jgi:curved DNA-binding protein CbpA